jgi:hypothetical protein
MASAAASITDLLLQADARGEPSTPAGLTFLARRYAATGADEIGDVLGRGLATALDRLYSGGRWNADWVHTLCEAAIVADDERIADALAAAASGLRERWPCRDGIAEAMRSVDASLTAAAFLGDRQAGGDFIRAAVDELERMISIAYHPGDLLPRSLGRPDQADGGVVEHAAAATTLLTAYDVTGRLPYSMLAEELIQLAGGPEGPHYVGGPAHYAGGPEGLDRWSIGTRCALARALCRLARLHDDEEYRRAAVVAEARDYRAAAAALVDGVVAEELDASEDAALVGIALDDLARAS